LNEEKSKCAGLAQEKCIWLSVIAQVVVPGKWRSKVVHLQRKKGVINII
jgi:hypothetical protein